MKNKMSNYISYSNLLQDRENFRKSGTKSGSEFNLFDTPGHKYFKIFFYFNNGDVDGNQKIESGNGLLSPTWLLPGVDESSYYLYNSAWSYLKMNAEDERADLLVNFVNLLSNISSESPWYFSEISGLDAAMDRKMVNSDNFSIDNTRQKISIKCLPDAYDDRIGALLDLYRAITWSWTTKREIVPANLRKFDMGILIYETTTKPFHKMKQTQSNQYKYAGLGTGNSTEYITSYKYIELHNCEFDYSSSKNNYSTLNNKDGFQIEYSIDINFDDCYETRYNEFMLKTFGDLIEADILTSEQFTRYIYKETPKDYTELQKRIDYYDSGFIKESVDQLISTGIDVGAGFIKKAFLGNLYNFSLSKLNHQVTNLIQGNVLGTHNQVQNYLKQQKKRIQPRVKYLGNIYKGNTIANNL